MMYLKNFVNDEEGQDMVEYALLLSLVAVACISILLTIGTDVSGIFTKAKTTLATAT